MKRLLYLIHRWAGIFVALFMFVWFTSGLIIMYAGPSAVDLSEQLEHRENLSPESGWLSLAQVWSRSVDERAAQKFEKPRTESAAMAAPKSADLVERIVTARLVRQANQPLWLVENNRGQRFALSALDGSLHTTSADEAALIASTWISHNAEAEGIASNDATIRYLDTGPQDTSVRNYEAIRPFHRFAIGDDSREVLISQRTGEVVRDSTRFNRALYFTGNWIHLLRPIETISNAATRRNVQIWSGFIAASASLTGLIIGWQRWRPGWFGSRTYSQGRVHPYRDVWNTWHFWVGLIGGSAALLWALSGYLSTNPFQIFSPANPNAQELNRYQGANVPAVMLNWLPTAIENNSSSEISPSNIVELNWQYLDDQATLLGITRNGERIPQQVAGAVAQIDEEKLLAAASRLSANASIKSHTLQTEYDSYYYLRHHQNSLDRPLPVLRIDLADNAGTHLYLDPQSGRLVLKQDTSRRVYRWLYSALHHWDFGWLNLRPLWDLWMLPLVSMGVVLGSTSVVLGWKRLQIEFKPKKKKRTAPARVKPVASPSQAEPNLSGQ